MRAGWSPVSGVGGVAYRSSHAARPIEIHTRRALWDTAWSEMRRTKFIGFRTPRLARADQHELLKGTPPHAEHALGRFQGRSPGVSAKAPTDIECTSNHVGPKSNKARRRDLRRAVLFLLWSAPLRTAMSARSRSLQRDIRQGRGRPLHQRRRRIATRPPRPSNAADAGAGTTLENCQERIS